MRCGLILAGGDSTRMGMEKHSLKISQVGMVEMVAEALQSSGCEPLLIATRKGRPWPGWDGEVCSGTEVLGVKPGSTPDGGRKAIFVADDRGWVGPQAGLASGLHVARDLGCEWVQLAPCDIPLLNRDLLVMLQGVAAPKYGAVVPEGPNGLEPLLALVQPEMMLEALHRVRESERMSIFAVLEVMVVKKISRTEIVQRGIDDSSFLNVNSPEDLHLARDLSNR